MAHGAKRRSRAWFGVTFTFLLVFGAAFSFAAAPASAGFTSNCPNGNVAEEFGIASGGLGLTCDEWESMYGPGEVGQSAIYYQAGETQYFVTYDQDTALLYDMTVFFGPLPTSANEVLPGVDLFAAAEYVESFLIPTDAVALGETQVGEVGIYLGTLTIVYQSDDLAFRLDTVGLDNGGLFAVSYTFQDPAIGTGVERVDIQLLLAPSV